MLLSSYTSTFKSETVYLCLKFHETFHEIYFLSLQRVLTLDNHVNKETASTSFYVHL
jgi:hypothetical protein